MKNMMKIPMQSKLLTLLLPLFLTACGGGAGGATLLTDQAITANNSTPTSPTSPASSPPNSPKEFINGIAVPPHPGDATDVTVAGIDSDGNGIRDEVDRALAKAYGTNPKNLAAAQYSAKINQQLLITDANDPVTALAAMKIAIGSGECLSKLYTMNITDRSMVYELARHVDALSFNTPERRAYETKIEYAAGQILYKHGTAVCPQ